MYTRLSQVRVKRDSTMKKHIKIQFHNWVISIHLLQTRPSTLIILLPCPIIFFHTTIILVNVTFIDLPHFPTHNISICPKPRLWNDHCFSYKHDLLWVENYNHINTIPKTLIFCECIIIILWFNITILFIDCTNFHPTCEIQITTLFPTHVTFQPTTIVIGGVPMNRESNGSMIY